MQFFLPRIRVFIPCNREKWCDYLEKALFDFNRDLDCLYRVHCFGHLNQDDHITGTMDTNWSDRNSEIYSDFDWNSIKETCRLPKENKDLDAWLSRMLEADSDFSEAFDKVLDENKHIAIRNFHSVYGNQLLMRIFWSRELLMSLHDGRFAITKPEDEARLQQIASRLWEQVVLANYVRLCELSCLMISYSYNKEIFLSFKSFKGEDLSLGEKFQAIILDLQKINLELASSEKSQKACRISSVANIEIPSDSRISLKAMCAWLEETGELKESWLNRYEGEKYIQPLHEVNLSAELRPYADRLKLSNSQSLDEKSFRRIYAMLLLCFDNQELISTMQFMQEILVLEAYYELFEFYYNSMAEVKRRDVGRSEYSVARLNLYGGLCHIPPYIIEAREKLYKLIR